MEGQIEYNEAFDSYLKMPEEMLPPESAYRMQPNCKRANNRLGETQVFSKSDRLIFGGGVKYTTIERTNLQAFYQYVKTNKFTLWHGLYFPLSFKAPSPQPFASCAPSTTTVKRRTSC